MKKLIAMIMAVAMVLALAACGGNSAGNSASGNDTPVVVAESAVEILEKVWATYGEDEKFPPMGGNSEAVNWEAPASFSLEATEELTYLLYLPADQIANVDDCASLIHAMNQNTFTCGVFHVADAANVQTVVDALKGNISTAQWVCGFPDKMIISVVGGDYIVSAFGNAEIMDNFQSKLTAQYGENVTVAVEENLA